MPSRLVLAVATLALVAGCSTNDQRQAPPPPPVASDAPIAGSAAVGASNVQFGDNRAAPPPVTDPLTLEEPDPNAIVVPGQTNTDRPQSPDGDPRNAVERRRDRRAFDQCVVAAQRRLVDDSGAVNPVGSTPEEYCSERLGMATRDSIPESRR